MSFRSYEELDKLKTFEERIEYLRLDGEVGVDTFGFERVFNQLFYHSKEWKDIRNHVIVRDNGCDLGIRGREIPDGIKILIHHMNPISISDIERRSSILLNPNYLITTTYPTHNEIHYGNKPIVSTVGLIERTKNDTCPWRRNEGV